MFNRDKVKVGICPIAWNNEDLPEMGGDITFEQCISEAALAGFDGSEIGGKYPRDAKVLLSYLEPRKQEIASAWFSALLTTEPYEQTEERFIVQRDYLHELGAKVMVVSEQGGSIQGMIDVPVFENQPTLKTDAEWARLVDGLNRLGARAKERGMTVVFHHHMGTVVQSAAEVDRLMAETDPELVSLLFDAGHIAYCGDDPLAMLTKHIDRVKHVHLKDIRPEVVERVKREHLSFLDGVRLGTFTVPGDGAIDFVPMFELLAAHNYEGWLLVEAEQDPVVANPFLYALKARAYIREKAGI